MNIPTVAGIVILFLLTALLAIRDWLAISGGPVACRVRSIIMLARVWWWYLKEKRSLERAMRKLRGEISDREHEQVS